MKKLMILVLMVSQSVSAQLDDEMKDSLAHAHKQIERNLKDADSAKYRAEYLLESTRKDGSKYFGVCGEINAKNSYGGYIGYVPYYVFGSQAEVYSSENKSDFMRWYSVLCDKSLTKGRVIDVQYK